MTDATPRARPCVALSECDKTDHDADWRTRPCFDCKTAVCFAVEDIHLTLVCGRCYEVRRREHWGSSTMARIRNVPGIPRWFTRLLHLWRVRRCRREGHTGQPQRGGCCIHCGYVWFT